MKLRLGVLLLTGLLLAGCDQSGNDVKHIKVGVINGAEQDVAEVAKKVAKEKYGLDVELVGFSGSLLPIDATFPLFIAAELPMGVTGLIIAGIFAAAMSTLSSSLNSCATAATRDLYRPFAGASETPERELAVTRILTALFGVLQIAVGIGGQWLESSVVSSVLGVAAFTTGIVLGIFFLDSFAPRVGQRAALAGLVVGLVAMTTIYFATPLAWPWYALVGSAITFGAGWLASWPWPREATPAAA